MANLNSLVALSYIRHEDNQHEMLCRFIQYCMVKLGKDKVTCEDIQESILKHFGINLPLQICKLCIDLLEKQGLVSVLKNPKRNVIMGYKLLKTNFLIDVFESEQSELQNKQNKLFANICEFANKQYHQNWDNALASSYLLDFLCDSYNASELFLETDFAENYVDDLAEISPEALKQISGERIIKSYIGDIISYENESHDYLLDIIRGLMIYIGVYYSDPKSNIADTDFYIDTKIVLRFLGYAPSPYVEAARDLVKMIKSSNGNICVFEHTILEVKNALIKARNTIKANRNIQDVEMNLYYGTNKSMIDIDSFLTEADMLKNTLENNNFIIAKDIDVEDPKNKKYSIGDAVINEIQDTIKNIKSAWNDHSIANDVKSINYINILRKSDYSLPFGGRNHLPIFVTSNHSLVNIVQKYINSMFDDTSKPVTINKGTQTWTYNKSPMITDTVLTYQLWITLSSTSEFSNLPRNVLVSKAQAILAYDMLFYNKLKETAQQFEEKYRYRLFDLNSERLRNLEDYYILKSKNFATDDEEDIMLSINEMEAFNRDQLSEKNESLKEENSNMEKIIEVQCFQIPLKSKIWVFIGKHWWWISTVILLIISIPITNLTSISNPADDKIARNSILIPMLSLLPTITKLILEIIKKIFSRSKFEKGVRYFCNKQASKKFKLTLEHTLKKLPLSETQISKIRQNCIKKFDDFLSDDDKKC